MGNFCSEPKARPKVRKSKRSGPVKKNANPSKSAPLPVTELGGAGAVISKGGLRVRKAGEEERVGNGVHGGGRGDRDFVPVLTLEEVKEATGGFQQQAFLGEGSTGRVFSGQFPDGTWAAVKILRLSVQSEEEFLMGGVVSDF